LVRVGWFLFVECRVYHAFDSVVVLVVRYVVVVCSIRFHYHFGPVPFVLGCPFSVGPAIPVLLVLFCILPIVLPAFGLRSVVQLYVHYPLFCIAVLFILVMFLPLFYTHLFLRRTCSFFFPTMRSCRCSSIVCLLFDALLFVVVVAALF